MEPETTPQTEPQTNPPLEAALSPDPGGEMPTPPVFIQEPQQELEVVSRAQLGTAVSALALLLVLVAAVEFTTGGISPASFAAAAQATERRAPNAFDDVTLKAKSAYVGDLTTGEVLFTLNPDVQLPLASLTKITLALAVSEVLPLESRITIPRDTAPAGSAERLAAGETWTVQDILDFTLVASSNGGAQILADAADEGLRARHPEFRKGEAALARMNGLARELGLSSTYFLNVHGLDESETQAGAFGSARDVATLFEYARRTAPDIFANTARKDLVLSEVNGRDSTSAFNTNEALGDIPGLIMGKTGFTDLAGGNLAVVFDAGLSHPVVIVVMGSTRQGRFDDMRELVSRTLKEIAAPSGGLQ